MNIWLSLITETSIPLAILTVVGYFALRFLKEYMASQQKKDEQNRGYLVERVEVSEKRQEELVCIGRELSETTRILSERFTSELSDIKDEVSDVSSKLDILSVKLDSNNKK